MNEVKDPHMITRAYLKAWADANHKIDLLDAEDRRHSKVGIRTATTVEYAYKTLLFSGEDLEGSYGRIESQGLPVIVKLRSGQHISRVEKTRLIAFLDMHLDRGRYADQSKILTAGIAVGKDLSLTPIQLNMADRIVLSQFMEGPKRLGSHGMESWHWEVGKARDLITGDGAVVLWLGEEDGALVGAGFPLAPDRLLVIGPDLPAQQNFNEMVRNRSRRWLVGQRGQFTRRR